MPQLTVIMPARNSATTIRLAIRSTLGAMPLDSELVVWDDGSSDETVNVVESVKDKRLRVLGTSSSAVGPGRARIELFDQTDSELVATMDSDDVSLPWRFRYQLRLLEKADITFAPAVWFGPRWFKMRPTNLRAYTPSDARVALLFHMPFSYPTSLSRREAIVRAGGFSAPAVAEDYDLVLRAASRGVPIVRGSVPTLLYRISAKQVTKAEDYAMRCRNAPELRESYSHLYEMMTGTAIASSAFEQQSRDAESDRTHFDQLGALISEMSFRHRHPYRKYADRSVGTMIGG